jgi:hypothetical protein
MSFYPSANYELSAVAPATPDTFQLRQDLERNREVVVMAGICVGNGGRYFGTTNGAGCGFHKISQCPQSSNRGTGIF